ncbi:MAG TPA: glutaredoxin family protein [Mycobacteriales bacterium]|nr:glutaredoxin family protein [Mycobacteriales bacterium]
MPPADHRLTLVAKPGCPACDTARTELMRIAADLGVPFDERDATADPADFAEYGDRLPVFLVDGAEHGYWAVEEARLRRALAR